MSFRTLLFTVIAALTLGSSASVCAQTQAAKGRVVIGKLGRAKKSVAIRQSPSSSSTVFYRAKAKDYLVINNGPKAGWLRVLLQNGTSGYVESAAVETLPYSVTSASQPARATTVASRGDARSQMADYALKFQGTPYVWGGNDVVNGVDCSGFVKNMYGAIGLKLPRTAAEQALVGTPINRLEDLRKGDRLYFWDAKRGKIGHTGIYLGNGSFVHSSSGRGGVATDYLGTQRWLKILVAARR